MNGIDVIRWTVQEILDDLSDEAQRSLLLAMQLGSSLAGKPFSEAIQPLVEPDGTMHEETKRIVVRELQARLC